MLPIEQDLKTVWHIVPDLRVFRVLSTDIFDDSMTRRLRFDGTRVDSWDAPVVHEDRTHLQRPDIYRLDGTTELAFSDRAVELLESDGLLGSAGQLLPLIAPGVGSFWVLNILNVSDALNREETKWLGNVPSTGMAEIPSFDSARLVGPSIFKIAPRSWHYCWGEESLQGAGFRNAVTGGGLHGLNFFKVWDTQNGGARSPMVPG